MKRIMLAFAGIVICAVALHAAPLSATQTLQVNLSDLNQAQLVFTGTCTARDAHIKNGMLETTYTFKVPAEGVVKGNVPETFQFTQWGGSIEDAKRLGVPAPSGIVSYEIGKEYTLFLTGESKLGFRSPVGLGQGKFNVVQGPDGKKQVVNDFNNKSLFVGLPASKSMTKALSTGGIQGGQQGGPIDLENFQKMIKELNRKE